MDVNQDGVLELSEARLLVRLIMVLKVSAVLVNNWVRWWGCKIGMGGEEGWTATVLL